MLFIDLSKRSLKLVFKRNGNKLNCFLDVHSIEVKEEYHSIFLVMEGIMYMEYRWVIGIDLKMVNIFLGQQGG